MKPLKLLIFSLISISSFSFTSTTDRQVGSYKEIFRKEHSNWDVTILGNSYLGTGKNYTYQLDSKKRIRKAYLIWSGEALKKPEDHDRLSLVSSGKSTNIKAKELLVNYSKGNYFLAYQDITKFVLNHKEFTVDFLGSFAKSPGYAGHGLVIYFESENKGKKGHTLQVGLEALYPGAIHRINLPHVKKMKLSQLLLVGGHGLKGNGSSTLINGQMIGTGDDWNGSNGERWDIDLYQLDSRSGQNNPLYLQIDPLLQWIFPLVISSTWEKN